MTDSTTNRLSGAGPAMRVEPPVAPDERVRHDRRAALSLLLIGGVCGLAWAAGLRGLMAVVAGAASTVDWTGTFVWILLPGVVTGLLLGWAEHLRRTGGRRGWRWLALAPLSFASLFVYGIGDLSEFFETGLGGGTIAIPLIGMAGGYALSGRGPIWARAASGVIALVPVPMWALTAETIFGAEFALGTPRGAWVALFLYSFVAVLALACAIPHRPVAVRSGHS